MATWYTQASVLLGVRNIQSFRLSVFEQRRNNRCLSKLLSRRRSAISLSKCITLIESSGSMFGVYIYVRDHLLRIILPSNHDDSVTSESIVDLRSREYLGVNNQCRFECGTTHLTCRRYYVGFVQVRQSLALTTPGSSDATRFWIQ